MDWKPCIGCFSQAKPQAATTVEPQLSSPLLSDYPALLPTKKRGGTVYLPCVESHGHLERGLVFQLCMCRIIWQMLLLTNYAAKACTPADYICFDSAGTCSEESGTNWAYFYCRANFCTVKVCVLTGMQSSAIRTDELTSDHTSTRLHGGAVARIKWSTSLC